MNKSTKSITEGAMMLAIIAMVLLVNRQFAGALEFFFMFLSIPVSVYTYRYGMRMGLVLCFCSAFLGFLFSSFTSIFYLITFLICGAFYGYGTRKKFKNSILLGGLIIVNLIATYLEVIVLSSVFGYNIQEETNEVLNMLNSYYTGSVSVTQYVVTFVILSYVAIAVMQGLVVHLFSILIMKRLGCEVNPPKSIYTFSFPRWCGFFVIMSFIGFAYSYVHPLSDIANNTFVAFYCIGEVMSIIQGVVCILRRKRNNNFFFNFAIMVSCILPIIKEIIAAVGVVDMLIQPNRGGQQ